MDFGLKFMNQDSKMERQTVKAEPKSEFWSLKLWHKSKILVTSTQSSRNPSHHAPQLLLLLLCYVFGLSIFIIWHKPIFGIMFFFFSCFVFKKKKNNEPTGTLVGFSFSSLWSTLSSLCFLLWMRATYKSGKVLPLPPPLSLAPSPLIFILFLHLWIFLCGFCL